MRKSKALILLAIVVVFASTSTAFAFNSNSASVNVKSSSSGVADVHSQSGTYNPTYRGKYNQSANWSVVVGQTGSVSGDGQPGDLYNVTTPGNPDNLRMTLYLNNPAKLSNDYSYLNLNVSVYEKNTSATGNYTLRKSKTLALTDGYVTFNVNQTTSGTYSISISGGSFYADSNSPNGTLSPSYYLKVRGS